MHHRSCDSSRRLPCPVACSDSCSERVADSALARAEVSCSLELPVCAACKKHAITLGQDPATVLCDYPVGPEELAEIAHRRASWDERFAHARGMTTATVSGEDQYDSLIGGWHDSPKRRTRSSVTAIESALEESKAGPGGSYLGPNASSSPSKSINKPAIKRHDSDSSSLSSASDDSAVDLTFGSRMKKVTKKVVRKQSVQRVAKNVKSAAVTKRDAGVGSTVATKEVGVQTENRLALPALAAVAAVNSATEILNRPQYHTRQPMPGVQHHHQQLPQQPEQQCQPEASYARYQQQSPYAQQRSQSHQHCIEHGSELTARNDGHPEAEIACTQLHRLHLHCRSIRASRRLFKHPRPRRFRCARP